MKILDKYLLKTFLITFTTVFVILFFIFILQTVWLFISELAGKDLDTLLIIKFLLFSMPRIIPLVLPLSVLLASIMTFGSLAENYEFAAMKSSGISLQRAMKSLVVFIVILSGIAFIFANNVIPYAEFKFINFRRNLAQVKPALAIVEGQFSEIGLYTIKVEKKLGEKGNFLKDIIIHIKSPNGEGNRTVIVAKDGELISNETSNTLKLVLHNGYYYEDVIPTKYEERERLPFAKASFKRDVINIDLSKLNTNMDTGEIANTCSMLNISEINYTLDSLNKNYKKDIISHSENIAQRLNFSQQVSPAAYTSSTTKAKINYTDLLAPFPKDKKIQLLNIAKSTIESTLFQIDASKIEMEAKIKNINEHWISLYDKFVIAFACILMFFIGAPLGAIIRKGGLGMPIVFAVIIFIVFHFVNSFGKRVAQEGGITPFLGSWMSSFVLTPLALLLTYRAIKDIGEVISFDGILLPIQKLFGEKFNSNRVNQNLIDLKNYKFVEDDEWFKLNEYSNDVLVGIVKNDKQFNYSNDYRTKALIVLDKRGITQQQLLQENNLFNLVYQNIDDKVEAYYKYSKVAIILNIITIISSLVLNNNRSNTIITVFEILLMLFFFTTLYLAQKKLDEIGKITGRIIEPGIAVAMVVGFPFYFFIYFYNNKMLKEVISEYR